MTLERIDELINVLKSNSIKLESGLSCEEIAKIEQIYGIKFPRQWCDVFTRVLPIEQGFYNWRDMSDKNILFIKDQLLTPYKDILGHLHDVNWDDEWGDEPNDENQRAQFIKNKMLTAPRLIPIYRHRYLPVVNDKVMPVLSIRGLDIICYGRNLTDYFDVEFNGKMQEKIDYRTLEKVPFWLDDIY